MSAGEARALLAAHADRDAVGALPDAAAVAAVVGVERLSVAAGTTDPGRLRDLLTAPSPELRALVAEVVGRVDEGLDRTTFAKPPDSSVVNADSGHHAVATGAAQLRAGVRAAMATWQRFPYYAARYGARGSRFAGSDSSWLVSLAPLPSAQAIGQVGWLARILAQRGMPSWLLERHLDDLAAELDRSIGSGESGALPAAAEELRARRRSVVDDALLVAADVWAAEELREGLPVERTGALLAAAHADVVTGLVTSDASLVDWLTESARATEATVAGVRRLRERVRAAARPAATTPEAARPSDSFP